MTQIENYKLRKSEGLENFKRSDWVCIECGNTNFRSRDTCTKTGCENTQAENFKKGGASKDDWTCNGCFGLNTAGRNLCMSIGCSITYESNRETDLEEGAKIAVVKLEKKVPDFKWTESKEEWRERGREERRRVKESEGQKSIGLTLSQRINLAAFQKLPYPETRTLLKYKVEPFEIIDAVWDKQFNGDWSCDEVRIGEAGEGEMGRVRGGVKYATSASINIRCSKCGSLCLRSKVDDEEEEYWKNHLPGSEKFSLPTDINKLMKTRMKDLPSLGIAKHTNVKCFNNCSLEAREISWNLKGVLYDNFDVCNFETSDKRVVCGILGLVSREVETLQDASWLGDVAFKLQMPIDLKIIEDLRLGRAGKWEEGVELLNRKCLNSFSSDKLFDVKILKREEGKIVNVNFAGELNKRGMATWTKNRVEMGGMFNVEVVQVEDVGRERVLDRIKNAF